MTVKQTTDVLIVAARLRSQDAQNQIKALDVKADALREQRDQLSIRLRALGINCTEQRKRMNDSMSKVLKQLDDLNKQREALTKKRNEHDKEFNSLRIGEVPQTDNSAQSVCDKAYLDYVNGLNDSLPEQPKTPQLSNIMQEQQRTESKQTADQAYADYVKSLGDSSQQPKEPTPADAGMHNMSISQESQHIQQMPSTPKAAEDAYQAYVNSFGQQEEKPADNNADLNWK